MSCHLNNEYTSYEMGFMSTRVPNYDQFISLAFLCIGVICPAIL